ncbi:MAG: S26 family signal peptidase [Acidimicrobiales bacterium]|nr:S26 family signal peptidase [Acidimicrobiales bacterium]
MLITRERTLAALLGAATVLIVAAASLERHVVRGESMKPTLLPRDTAISVRVRSPLGAMLRLARHPRPGDIAVIELPWEHDLIGIKRLVAGPGDAWSDGGDSVRTGPGWVAVGDQRTLSTDSRHHGRVPTGAIRAIMLAKVAPPDR